MGRSKRMKKTLSLLLALSMMLSAVGMAAGAEGTVENRIIDDGTFTETTIGEGIVEPAFPHPVNPYSELALRQPAEVTASSSGITISGPKTVRTGESCSYSAAGDTAVTFQVQIWQLDRESNSYSTVYLVRESGGVCNYVFYDTGEFLIQVDGWDENGTYIGAADLEVTVSAGASGTTIAEKVAALKAECLSEVSDPADEYEVALWMHDWLIYNANYDYDYSIYGADGVLFRGTGVCDSYSKAYDKLLKALGIDTMRQTGTARGENHAWNLAKIDGTWSQFDCTWDDPNQGGGAERHNYFGLNDSIMARNHSWDPDGYPTCNSLDNFFYYREGYTLFASDEELAAALNGMAEIQRETVKLYYIGEVSPYSVYSAFSSWFYTWNWKYGLLEYNAGSAENEYIITYGEPWEKPVEPDAADFTLSSPHGRYEFAQYRGNNGLVLIFGRTTCGNTRAFLQGMSESVPEINSAGVDVLVSLIDSTSVEDVLGMEQDFPGFRFAYDNQSLMWEYLGLVGQSGTVYFPCVFYVNDEGKIVEYSTNYVNNMEHAVQRALSLGTGNPIPDPIRHNDYSAFEQGTGTVSGVSGGTIIEAVRQAIQSDYVYLSISYSPDVTLYSQFEEKYSIYSRFGIRMIASVADGGDYSESYPNVQFVEYDNNDFWKLLRTAGFDTSGSMSYTCGYLIEPSGTILKAVNGNRIDPDEFAGYLASTLQYESVIPDALTVIESEAFEGDASLYSISLDNGALESIGEQSFSGCTNLAFALIPDSVTSIAESTFSDCDQLCIICTIGSEAFFHACNYGIPYLCI